MTATLPIVCVPYDGILDLLAHKQVLCQQRPLATDEPVVQLVRLLDDLQAVNRQIVEWLVLHIPAELLTQAAEVAAGGGG